VKRQNKAKKKPTQRGRGVEDQGRQRLIGKSRERRLIGKNRSHGEQKEAALLGTRRTAQKEKEKIETEQGK